MCNKTLTIGMATYDDFDGLFFTIQSLRMYHPICNTDEIEFIVIDNNPNSKHGEQNQKFVKRIFNARYIPFEDKTSSFVKYCPILYASGEYIIIMDCHVLLYQNAVDFVLQYFNENPKTKNLIQGPMVMDDLNHYNTHWNPEFRGHMFGTWSNNKPAFENGEPFEIPLQGAGVMAFKKSNWVGVNSNFRGFGGEEGYIHEKFRMNGGKVLCLPQFKWMHRFGRPNGVPFPLKLEDRVWNYFLGYLELYKNPNHSMINQIYEHFKTQINENIVLRLLNELKANPQLWK